MKGSFYSCFVFRIHQAIPDRTKGEDTKMADVVIMKL